MAQAFADYLKRESEERNRRRAGKIVAGHI